MANDILLFMDDNDDYLQDLFNALKAFEATFGLSINLIKSILFDISVVVLMFRKWLINGALVLNFLPLSYHGAPLGGKSTSPHFWE